MTKQDYLDRFFPIDRAENPNVLKVWQAKRKLIAAYFEQIPRELLAEPTQAVRYAQHLKAKA